MVKNGLGCHYIMHLLILVIKYLKESQKSFTINLQKERYKYSRGQYKIVKPFSFSTNEMKDSMVYYFSIK